MKGKIIQIIPAPSNLFAVYNMGLNFEEEEAKIICLALTNEGEILEMVMDDDIGYIEEARAAECFKCFKWK
ncbi:MAG: hypothetical protein WA125_16705 [Desulfosporosinus sp.]